MNNPAFGKLERITNIREYWPHEATDFTPWLGSEENIAILSDAIGMELEVQEQEVSVGRYSADILCKNVSDNSYVVIENQYGKTDHDHLGKLLTYMAGLETATAVWIVESFTDEHRATLDFLNKISDDKFYFFGVEIELWKIGNSPPAPKFNVISKPNEWVKIVKETTEASRFANLTPWEEMKIEFWREFGNYLSQNSVPFKTPKPSTTLWVGYGIGRAFTAMVVSFSQKDASVYVQIDGQVHPDWFNLLADDKEAIAEDYHQHSDEPLEWDDKEGRRYSRIAVSIDADITKPENWPMVFDWFVKHMTTMKKVFGVRMKALSG